MCMEVVRRPILPKIGMIGGLGEHGKQTVELQLSLLQVPVAVPHLLPFRLIVLLKDYNTGEVGKVDRTSSRDYSATGCLREVNDERHECV